ncbi:ABC transporter permease [Alkalibaculum sp. M08DMB]|uniref:ABC transporter permease n=1 Tax=Alkalibaculum sporogenes TaxID=2655001 RepID=A0A6A7K4R2_9FIRM|nr:ABC transporter permease subunit [Alkalibaculum sporogenes]MPW24365.1 ABC transporter permease [Alkalibaculum sporogenes]
MRSYIAFTKKEFHEIWSTYKFFILITVFLLLGMMNPITAKITPQLLDSFMPEGMVIAIAEPTALDSWMQFFSNVPQIGLIVLVIVFSGVMTSEFSRGTLINLLTKGLSRSTVILSKFTMSSAVWTLCYILCFAVTYFYTAYFWSSESINNIGFSVFCLWLFGILLLAIIMLGGVLFKNSYGGLLLTSGLVVVLMLVNIVPNLQNYNPISLASNNMALLTGDVPISDFTGAIVICGVGIIAFITSAIILFKKKQM